MPKTSFLAWLDRLPPIRLPIGPPIPWRYGVPAAVVLLVLWALLLGRPTSQPSESTNALRGPAVASGQTLFNGAQFQAAPMDRSVSVAQTPGSPVDAFDLSLKLLFVLALAYGSLALLKRATLGAQASRGALPPSESLRVLSTLTLAPNRTVHVVRAPGGKTLLLGATPSQVNLIADLGDVPEVDPSPQSGGTFLELLASKLPRT